MSLDFQLKVNLNRPYQTRLTVISFKPYLPIVVTGASLEAIDADPSLDIVLYMI